jgi:hypothetical protein
MFSYILALLDPGDEGIMMLVNVRTYQSGGYNISEDLNLNIQGVMVEIRMQRCIGLLYM